MNAKSLILWLTFALLPALLPGQATPWPHPDGTTHWYEVIRVANPIAWTTAESDAVRRGGHLATLTSSAENNFVFGLVDHPDHWQVDGTGQLSGPWIGGIQRPGSVEPDGGWVWVEGDPMAFTSWFGPQPNNTGGAENYLQFGGQSGLRSARWADRENTTPYVKSYVVEWSGNPIDQTVGLFHERPGSSGGYTLLPPILGDGNIHLLDSAGRPVHKWDSNYVAGLTTLLDDSGSIVRSVVLNATIGQQMWNGLAVGGLTGRIEKIDWDGNLVWSYNLSGTEEHLHHDLALLPNGNVLAVVYDVKSVAECIQAGRDPSLISDGQLWPDKIIEIEPSGLTGGNIVWEWNLWDHLIQDFDPTKDNYGVVENHPERVDINFMLDPGADWTHVNTVAYNPDRDEIMITVHSLSEVWVIDHSTTAAEAATSTGGNRGKGGDLLYRWGNPASYRAGTAADQRLFRPHDGHWIPAGSPGAGDIIIFNNGWNRPGGNLSSADQFTPPIDMNGDYILNPGLAYGPTSLTWEYRAAHGPDFYSQIMSGVQRLPNGNTLICSAVQGVIFEVTPDGRSVWHYRSPLLGGIVLDQGSPGNPCAPYGPCFPVFKTRRYPTTHPGLIGRTLNPGDPLEGYPLEIEARWGVVNAGATPVTDTLKLNGQVGDIYREVYVAHGAPLTLSIDAPPAGPTPGYFMLFLYVGEPSPAEANILPAGIGTAVMDMNLLGGTPSYPQLTLADSTGSNFFGYPILPGIPPAPTSVTVGMLPFGTFTVQGLILDNGSYGTGFSVTNAIVMTIL